MQMILVSIKLLQQLLFHYFNKRMHTVTVCALLYVHNGISLFSLALSFIPKTIKNIEQTNQYHRVMQKWRERERDETKCKQRHN